MTIKYQTVALLEPDPDILTLYEISLQEFGYSFKGFTDSPSLLEFIHKNPNHIKLLLIEYHFGGKLTGCQLADIVNSIDPNIRMAFLTGYHAVKDNRLELEIIMKPITLTRLLKLVKKYMD